MYDSETTGMHMQIEKGGGFHHHQAEQMGKPLELAVAIGGDPALILSAIMPLPEGLSEIQFCGFLRGSRTKLLKCKTIDLKAPAESEFILEGYLNPIDRCNKDFLYCNEYKTRTLVNISKPKFKLVVPESMQGELSLRW